MVTLAEIKAHTNNVGTSSDDTVLQGFVSAAVAYLDGPSGVLGRCLLTQTWEAPFAAQNWPQNLFVPFVDVQSHVVQYRDANDTLQTVAGDAFEVIRKPGGSIILPVDGFVAPALSSATAEPVTVAVTSGFGGASDVPEVLKLAVKQMADDFYHDRCGKGEISAAVDRLIAPWRRVVI